MPRSSAWSRDIFAWTLFDFANTGFYVVMISVVFPTFFNDVIAGGDEAYWGRAISASMLITALIGPLLGSMADATNRKKLYLGLFTTACIVATAAAYGTGPGTLTLAFCLLIVANVGFEGGTIFYDAFLPEIATPENYSRVSGYGFAMGYLGSLVVLGMILPILSAEGRTVDDVRLTFIIAAGFFAIFSLPLFLRLKEHRRAMPDGGSLLVVGYQRLRQTFTHIRNYQGVKRFLLAFFVYNDSILTVIAFASIYGKESLKMELSELILFFMVVQITALIGSLVFGRITATIGARQSIIITLVIWLGITIAAFLVDSKTGFFVIGGVAGIALGSSQSCSRTLMALLTPADKKTEFFGFYDGFFGKASATLGPLIYGEAASAYGQRPAMLVVGVLFLLGIGLMFRVPDARPQLAESAS